MHQQRPAEHEIVTPGVAASMHDAGLDLLLGVLRRSLTAGDTHKALRILRALAIAFPAEQGIWQGLARCHDALEQTTVAASLRAIGDAISSET